MGFILSLSSFTMITFINLSVPTQLTTQRLSLIYVLDTLFVVTFAGRGKLFPATAGLSHKTRSVWKCDCGVWMLLKLPMVQEDPG